MRITKSFPQNVFLTVQKNPNKSHLKLSNKICFQGDTAEFKKNCEINKNDSIKTNNNKPPNQSIELEQGFFLSKVREDQYFLTNPQKGEGLRLYRFADGSKIMLWANPEKINNKKDLQNGQIYNLPSEESIIKLALNLEKIQSQFSELKDIYSIRFAATHSSKPNIFKSVAATKDLPGLPEFKLDPPRTIREYKSSRENDLKVYANELDTIKETQISQMKKHFELIKNNKLRDFVEEVYNNTPKTFFNYPSAFHYHSNDGKAYLDWHPEDETKEGSQLSHIKRATIATKMFAEKYRLSKDETDLALTAILLHDVPNKEKEHPIVNAKNAEIILNQPAFEKSISEKDKKIIIAAILFHMQGTDVSYTENWRKPFKAEFDNDKRSQLICKAVWNADHIVSGRFWPYRPDDLKDNYYEQIYSEIMNCKDDDIMNERTF